MIRSSLRVDRRPPRPIDPLAAPIDRGTADAVSLAPLSTNSAASGFDLARPRAADKRCVADDGGALNRHEI